MSNPGEFRRAASVSCGSGAEAPVGGSTPAETQPETPESSTASEAGSTFDVDRYASENLELLYGYSDGGVLFHPTAVEEARRLKDRHPDVQVRAGVFPVPMPDGAGDEACERFRLRGDVAPSATLVATPGATERTPSGLKIDSEVEVINRSEQAIWLNAVPRLLLFATATAEAPVGIPYLPTAEALHVEELAPGGSVRISGQLTAASCQASLGHALPPGTYWLRVLVDQVADPSGEDEVENTTLVSEAVPIEID